MSRSWWVALLWLIWPVVVHASPIPEGTAQMILVTSADWRATTGRLQRYERTGVTWKPVGDPWPIVLGSGGLGWGQGLAAPAGGGPTKREGDGRSPAGVYRLNETYGYSSAPPPGTAVTYRALTAADRCVDDPQAREYNRIVSIGPDRPETWSSAEVMRRDDELYRWVIVVAHNSDPPRPAGGSCIFLHVWAGAASPTAGCTAMARGRIETLLSWLRPEAEPVIVQLPEAAYKTLRSSWRLP
ncbi:MAG: L,D-transpeptidase family protein [Aphanocapsa lilacina HA4352-LM1]|nr:L,D-transpeptidase family protein [Aphanocapsa lilacina HA4352-LM1]